jgi:hypothetical protein
VPLHRSCRPRSSPLQSLRGTCRPVRAGGTRFVPARAGSARPSIEHGLGDASLGSPSPVGWRSLTLAGSPPWVRRRCSGLLTPSASNKRGAPNASGPACARSPRIVRRPAAADTPAPSLEPPVSGCRAATSARRSHPAGAGAPAALAVRSGCACRASPRLIVSPSPMRLASLARAIVWQAASQRRCAIRHFPSRKHHLPFGALGPSDAHTKRRAIRSPERRASGH